MKNKLIIGLICLLASCQSYRAERKINKLKSWGYLKDSTITKYDTIRGFTLDSVYLFDTTTILDTITRIENGLKVSTVIKWKQREVRQVITKRDTILEHKYTAKILKENRKWSDTFWVGFWVGCMCILLGFVFVITLVKKIN
jgi:hypothetical protein